MGKWIGIILAGITVSFFYFPLQFTFLPAILNTKNQMAVLGLLFYFFDASRKRDSYSRRTDLGGALLWATVYSLWNFISVSINSSDDYSYATYISSAAVWFLAAYGAVGCVRRVHGNVSIRLITMYLAAVCAFQCLMAIWIDRNEAVRLIVDTYTYQGQDFMHEVNRLYGLGAMLDTAGVRFALVLILISFVLVVDEKVKFSKSWLWSLILCFMVISSLGNMISRTTTTGAVFALLVLLFSTGLYRLVLVKGNGKLYGVLGLALVVGVSIFVYLYNNDPWYYQQFRFAFEGFFNWVETGEWRTGSTDKLNAEMWIWPKTLDGWILGTGRFGLWGFGTDIGYCRLILYSGVIGFSIFSLFFVYNAFNFYGRYPRYKNMFLIFLAMSFIIWVKVSTDLFVIYAIFYSFNDEKELYYYNRQPQHAIR